MDDGGVLTDGWFKLVWRSRIGLGKEQIPRKVTKRLAEIARKEKKEQEQGGTGTAR